MTERRNHFLSYCLLYVEPIYVELYFLFVGLTGVVVGSRDRLLLSTTTSCTGPTYTITHEL